MRKTIRLYRRHDIDLISLYKNPDFNFQKACKMALRGYIQRKPVYFKQPPFYGTQEYKYGYQLFLYLDDEKDKDIIDYLKNIRPRYENAFIRSVLRGSVAGPIVYDCFLTDEDGNGRQETANSFSDNLQDYPRKNKRGRKVRQENLSDIKPVENKRVSDNTEKEFVPVVPKSEDTETLIKTKTDAFVSQPEPIIQPTLPAAEPTVAVSHDFNTTNKVNNETTDDSDDDFDLFGSLDSMMDSF